MNISIADSYEALSREVADEVISHLNKSEHPLFCPASGDTPTGLCTEIVKRHQQGIIDAHKWYFVGLDEWQGMNGEDEGSCRNYLDKHLFTPLEIKENHIGFFDGKAADPENECHRVEQFITANKGIDVIVLGLGLNGHIGMNEPGTSPLLHSHVSELAAVTKEVGQKYFKSQTSLSHGLTLGIASIMKAKHVILMVNGEKKASIVKKVIEGEITNDVPASLLRKHSSFSLFMDKAAAAKITFM
jgi:glucosamine-6-phosphate isomerase